MSSVSKRPSSGSDSSSCSRVSNCRPIPEIISSLRSAFLPADYSAAESELLSRESNLRRHMEDLDLNWRTKYDLLEKERDDLRLDRLQWDAERDRLARELKVAEDKLADLDLDLRTAKEKERKANERCGQAYKDIEAMVIKEQEMVGKLNKEEAFYRETLDSLRGEGEKLRKLLRKKDERIEELLRVEKSGMEAMADVKQLMKILNDNEERIKELKRKIAALEVEIKEKDDRIDGLLMENEGLRMELVKDKEVTQLEIEGLRAEEKKKKKKKKKKGDDGVVKKLAELESLVASWMVNVPKDKNLRDTQVGEILARFNEFLDSEQAALPVSLDSKVIKDANFAHGGDCTSNPKNKAVDTINLGSESSSSEDRRCLKRALSDYTSNPKTKVKKLNDLTNKSVKGGLFTPVKQAISTIRKCNENSMNEGNSQDNGGSAEATTGFSQDIKNLLDTCRRSKGSIRSIKQGA